MSSFSWRTWARAQYTPLPPVQHVDLRGRTVVITGANVGLGFEAAKHFARMRPARLVLACRSRDTGETALAELAKDTGYDGAELLLIDMATFASVSTFVDEFEKTHDRLDILMLNAGVALFEYQVSKEGFEMQLQVNYLSTALLSLLLLPRMVQTGQAHSTHPHLVVVTSESHLVATFDMRLLDAPSIFEKMSDRTYFTRRKVVVGRDRYNLTKLFDVMLVRTLTAKLPSTSPVVVSSPTPGFCQSTILRTMPFLVWLIMRPMELLFARGTEAGSRTLVAAALTGEDGDAALRDSARGAYIDSCKVTPPKKWLVEKDGIEAERRIWDETVQVLEKADPRVRQVIEQYLTVAA